MTAGGTSCRACSSAGVLLTSFQTMAMSVATERDDGTLKRLRATPMPPVAYFLGKVGLVAVSSTVQVALLLLVARLAFGVELPTTADRWAVFALVFVLGVFGGTVLGDRVLLDGHRRAPSVPSSSARCWCCSSSPASTSPSTTCRSGCSRSPSLFPLKWIAQGMRSVFYPDAAGRGRDGRVAGRRAAPSSSCSPGPSPGLVLCVLTFRWFKRGTT